MTLPLTNFSPFSSLAEHTPLRPQRESFQSKERTGRSDQSIEEVFSFFAEILKIGTKGNSIVLLTSSVATSGYLLPESNRPYFLVIIFILGTILLDFKYYVSTDSNPVSDILLFGINIGKIINLRNILYHSPGAVQLRKYLHRRFRIFCPPCSRPRKVRREIISRVVAIELLQLISTVLYFILTVSAVSVLRFSRLLTNPPSHNIPLVVFYPIKLVTSLLVLYGLYLDTGFDLTSGFFLNSADVVIALSYFGCLSCWNIGFVREYIAQKRVEYGGWPVPYGLNPYRVYAVSAVKLIDILWGVGGWCTIGTTFGGHFFSQNSTLVGVVLASAICLIVSDLWIGLLFASVIELINFHNGLTKRKKKKNITLDQGDGEDSEMEEMGLLNLSLSSDPTKEDYEKMPANNRTEKKMSEPNPPVNKSRLSSNRFVPPKPFETVGEKQKNQEISADRMGDQFLSSRR